MSDIEIPNEESARDFILGELRRRYGEGFMQADGTGASRYGPDDDNEICYEVTAAPGARPRELFTSMVYVDAATGRQSFPVLDNYQQHLFTPLVCGPFGEYLAGLDGVDGYSVSLTWNRMDDEVWTEGEVERYMGAGRQGDPEVAVDAMVARAPAGDLARLIHRMHLDLAGLGRSMQIAAAITGSDIRKDNNEIYRTHLGYEIRASREGARLTYGDVLDEVASNMKRVTDDGWDGTMDAGDPDRALTSITWK